MHAAAVLYAATRNDHPCFDRDCEVAMALEAGLSYTAAAALRGDGAMAPTVNRTINGLGFDSFAAGVADEAHRWQEWLSVNTVTCRECGSRARIGSGACAKCRRKLA